MDSYEQRVYRLESQMTDVQKNLGEVMDRTKNAHHRIDETNNSIKELKGQLSDLNTKVSNIGKNLADKDKSDRKWRKVTIIVACLAIAAFVGMFIKDTENTKTIGEIALKVGAGVASTI